MSVPTDIARQLYYQMLRIRMVEEAIADLYAQQDIRCPIHLCIGQEAVAVGVCAALAADDYVLSGHRSHGHYLAKGGNLPAMLAEFYGKATGCCQGKGGSMHLVDLAAGFLGAVPIVGSTMPIAVGTALASVMRGEARVTAVFFGEGATEEGVFHESLNFAALQKLPVVFVCENNLYSVYSPLAVRQPAGREVVALARGHGVGSAQGDGNNVVEVYRLARQAIHWARSAAGPVFLEFKTYRWREHCGPHYDHDLGYRSMGEFEAWQQRCPLATCEAWLLREHILTPEDTARMRQEVEVEIQAAVVYAQDSPFPEAALAMEHIYAP
jgi:pyruvate dehydrogenase E1 component alpha subunit